MITIIKTFQNFMDRITKSYMMVTVCNTQNFLHSSIKINILKHVLLA